MSEPTPEAIEAAMKARRFDPVTYHSVGGESYGHMKKDDDGDYVEYSDYETLRAEVLRLRAELEDTRNQLIMEREEGGECAADRMEREVWRQAWGAMISGSEMPFPVIYADRTRRDAWVEWRNQHNFPGTQAVEILWRPASSPAKEEGE
jgi:hypothetical protein